MRPYSLKPRQPKRPERQYSSEEAREFARRYLRMVVSLPNMATRPREFAAKNFFASVGYALEGLKFAFLTQRNFRIDVVLAVGSLLMGALLGINKWEWIAIVMMMGLVLFAEAANTTVEWLVDLMVGERYDIRAKRIKDLAAGACLVMAACTGLVMLFIFLPYLLARFSPAGTL
jgi:diacylglycerol kinase